jgi:hypothetical protein
MKNIYLTILASVILYGGYMTLPRGIRNNNPGNIRHGDNWQGMKAIQTDKSFVQFESAKWGIRAMTRVLDSYRKRGIIYLVDIISTWAPPTENDTFSYVESVEKETGIYSNEKITREHYPKLIAAIIKHENGFNPYLSGIIEEGISLA